MSSLRNSGDQNHKAVQRGAHCVRSNAVPCRCQEIVAQHTFARRIDMTEIRFSADA
jgi:hypothetical protein